MKHKIYTKTDIINVISQSIDEKENIDEEVCLKNTPYTVHIKITLQQPDFVIDHAGQKWVKEN